MARSPFQGTYVNGARPTVVTAPDSIVLINGNSDVIGCPVCNKSFPFNKYITSVQVDLSIDSVPGSASLNLSVPRHAIDDFYFDNSPIICPMMEVEIYTKGHFLVEGLPQYYPIFWGLVTEVNDSYSGGEHSVSIHCADILKWWEVCKMATNSAFTSPHPGAMGMALFGNAFFGANPYDIIWTLAQQSFGDIIVGTGGLVAQYRESGAQKNLFNGIFADLAIYWEERFQRIRSNLMLYAANGYSIRGDVLNEYVPTGTTKVGKHWVAKSIAKAMGGPNSGQAVYDPTDEEVVAFRSNLNVEVPLWNSEYQTKLELGTAAKEAIGFELYMDVDGSVVFKPPFYNLDVLGNKPISWIQDIDIIDWDFSSSESEVVTQIIMQGSYGGNVDYGLAQELTPMTSVTDFHLLRQYGWRSQTFNSEFLGDTNKMFYVGLDMLDRWNARRHRGTVTIPIRPELRLGFPVYIAPKDEVWYVSGISHNIAYGGRATTSLTLTARRKKFIAPQGIGTLSLASAPQGTPTTSASGQVSYSSKQLSQSASFNLKMGTAATFPPTPPIPNAGSQSPYDPLILRNSKTGRIVGYPNAVMLFTRSFQGTTDQTGQVAGHRPQSSTNPDVLAAKKTAFTNAANQTASAVLAPFNAANTDTRVREQYLNNRYQYGLNSAGAYVYAYDKADVIKEVLIFPNKNLHIQGTSGGIQALQGASGLIRPVSDERGFEVVGVFRYGRGVMLRDGNLVVQQQGQRDSMATVSEQTALGGDLYATLNAQAQGITSVTSAYQNPAATLSTLTPEDLQTAGFVNPDTGPQYYTPPTTPGAYPMLGDPKATTLNSPQQAGVPNSVEAGQLSNGLTLYEMVPKTGDVTSDTECACLLGRADLIFISSGNGYSVSTLSSPNAATPDQGNLAPATAAATNTPVPVNDSQAVPMTPQEVENTIDTFLYNLYNQLDQVHQQYENALRGDPTNLDPSQQELIAQSDQELVQNVEFGTSGNGFANVTPPYGPGGPGQTDNPIAIAQQADSALSSLSQNWQNFGASVKSNAQRAQLTQQIQGYQSQISSLQTQIKALSQPNVVAPGDTTQTLKNLESQLYTTQQQLANAQSQLAALPPASTP
jgi:hypothetical protein